MKRSQESSSPNSLQRVKASTCRLVSRHSVSVRQNSSSNPKKSGEYEILSSVNLGRKKYELRMLFCSANFGNRELRMVQKTLEICLSETHASGNREAQTADLSFQAMLIPDEKATLEEEWKEVIKEVIQKQKVRKVHFVALMDIRHIQ